MTSLIVMTGIFLLLAFVAAIIIIVIIADFLRKSQLWQERVMSILVEKYVDQLSFVSAQKIYTAFIQSTERDFTNRIIKIIEKNHIDDKRRRITIHQELTSFLVNQKDRLYRALDQLYCNGINLSDYVLTTDIEHTEEFIKIIEEILFDEVLTIYQKKTDLEALIIYHYNSHTNDAINFIRNNKKV